MGMYMALEILPQESGLERLDALYVRAKYSAYIDYMTIRKCTALCYAAWGKRTSHEAHDNEVISGQQFLSGSFIMTGPHSVEQATQSILYYFN
jgi:hypothetical protein